MVRLILRGGFVAAVLSGLWVSTPSVFSQGLDLGDIAAGGDGTGTAPAGNIGIDPRNGDFVTAQNANTIQETDPEGDGLNPSPTESDYIDAVFIIGPNEAVPLDPFPQAINQSGVTFDFPAADAIGTGWNYIFDSLSGGGGALRVGGLTTFTFGVGIHASMGITYDLNALRSTHGNSSVGCFSTAWGVDDCTIADINLYVILSDDSGIISSAAFPSAKADDGETLRVDIPTGADYLTLAVGSNGVDWCDHGVFAQARIAPGACPTNVAVQSVNVKPQTFSLGLGGSAQLKVQAIDVEGLPSTATAAASGTTYSAAPAGIVTVSADGLVTGVGYGTATVTATNGGVSGTATVKVEDVIFLSDVTAGGDGTGTAPAANIGIDPRNGDFVTTPYDGPIRESDAVGDGLNPSATDSDYIDSVFFIGPTLPQAITQSGVSFDFPSADAIATGWNMILSNRNAGSGTVPFLVAGVDTWASGMGIHASTGITYSLAALRGTYGDASVGCFSTTWGMDGCTGDVILYAIQSNDSADVLETRTFHATQNSGSYLQIDILPEADYLTLATGSNGADSCDHGNFGEPVIRGGSCVLPPLTAFAVGPKTAILAPGRTTQMKVTGTLASGLTTDLSPGATGTTYSIDAAGVATVSADGLVSGVANGRATLTVTNATYSDTASIVVQDFIDLGNMAAGGNGKTAPPAGNVGLNADTGQFVQARSNADVPEANGANPQPLDGSNGSATSVVIDSVFIMDVGVGQVVNSAGVTFDFDAGDAAGGWEAILNGLEPGGPDELRFGAFGPYLNGVGLHAAQGITYDLSGIRFTHQAANVKFASAIAGESSGQAGGSVNAYMILSDATQVLSSRVVRNASDSGEFIQLEIPSDAKYLTLATGAAGNGIGADHGAFGMAAITNKAVDVTSLSQLDALPGFARLDVGGEVQLELKGTMAAEGYAGLRTTIDPAVATFGSDNSGVATVDETGKITAVGVGRANITATVGAQSDSVAVIVAEDYIRLGDVTKGGDGSGNAPIGNLGIDPRNGNFVQVAAPGAPGTIRETDAEGDGVNPSSTSSDFIDSVFIIGPNEVIPLDPFPQAITQRGLEFNFPVADVTGTGYNYTFGDMGADAAAVIGVGGTSFTAGVGMHTSTGITYDLGALRSAHPGKVGRFIAYWGVDACGTADVNFYAILSNDSGVVGQATFLAATVNSGELLDLDIPSTASYLTLAAGSNGVDWCDHAHFAEAMIVPSGGTPVTIFRRGDADAKGGVPNITDGIYVLNYLFLGGPEPTCLEAANADDKGGLNITDGIYILNYLFQGGLAPPAPGPDTCGPEPAGSLDNVGCIKYDKC